MLRSLKALVLVGVLPLDLHAQDPDTVVIPPDPVCAACSLEVTRVVSLGDEEGEGFVDVPAAAGVSSEHYLVVNRSLASEIRVFDLDGEFERVVGREGQGPGEYVEIWDLQVSDGDSVHVIDLLNLRRTVLSPGLDAVRTQPFPIRPKKNGFWPLRDGGCVLNGTWFDQTGSMRLLHRLDSSGNVLSSFGDPVPASIEMRAGPESTILTPFLTDDNTLMVAHFADFTLSEWDLTLGQVRRLFLLPDRDWRSHAPTALGGVNPAIMDLRVDGGGRLWLLVRVGDPDWEEAVEIRRPGLGRRAPQRVGDRNGYWDSVVEVIDMESRRVLARKRFPQYLTQFLESGELLGYRITEDNRAVVEVFEVQLQGVDSPGKE